MSDKPSDTEVEVPAAEAEEAEPQAPLSEAEAADEAEARAAWDEVIAKEKGEDPPAPEVESEQPSAEEPADDAAGAEAGKAGDQEEAAGEQPPAEEPEKDIWADAPTELKEAFEAERRERSKAEHAFRSREGREAALQRRIDALTAGSGQEPAKPEDSQPSAEQDAEAETALRAELKTFADDYPEMATPLGKAMQFLEGKIARRDAQIDRLEAVIRGLGEERFAASSESQASIVKERHADYDDIAGSEEFWEWAQAQSEPMKALIEPNIETLINGEDVAFVLDRYKVDKGIVNGGTDGNGTAGTNGAGKPKPAADPIRSIQRRTATGVPASSPGAAVRESDARSTETEADVWAELRKAEERKQAAAARA